MVRERRCPLIPCEALQRAFGRIEPILFYIGHVQARMAERLPTRKRNVAAGVYEIVPTILMRARKHPMIERMNLHGFMIVPPRYVGCQIILVYEAFFCLIEKPYHGMSILSNDRLHHQNTRHKTKSPEVRCGGRRGMVGPAGLARHPPGAPRMRGEPNKKPRDRGFLYWSG